MPDVLTSVEIPTYSPLFAFTSEQIMIQISPEHREVTGHGFLEGLLFHPSP